jgi:hypothetical protein
MPVVSEPVGTLPPDLADAPLDARLAATVLTKAGTTTGADGAIRTKQWATWGARRS